MSKTRLEELREEKGLSKTAVAQILDVTDSVYSRWENDKDSIPTKRIFQLANFYQVNADYLMNLSDIRINNMVCEENIDLKISADRVREIRKENGYTLRDIANKLNTSSSTWSAYETGKHLILSTFLLEVCKDGNYSLDWVLGRTNQKYKENKKE